MAAGLLALAGDRQLRLRMGRAGQQRCLERWDSERMVDAYVEVLQDAAERRARQEPRGLRRRFARSFVDYVDRKGWVTRERVSVHANVLTVVNVWPEPSAPTRAPFVSVTVRGLLQAGVETDVLYVRGYRGAHCYLLACAVMALLPLAEPGKYRLVHSHAGETALPARFFWQGPVLGSYWGSDILGLAGQGSWRSRARFALTSRLLRLHTLTMSATTTKSEQMAQRLPARARARNWVIPDGVDLARVAPIDRLEARAALGWAPDELAVITVGRRTPSKRVWLAERAANLASREIPGLRWQAVSTVPPEQMPLYYSAADVLLHAAASEGSPNVVKEAMACNLPVVATDVGDIRELLAGVEPSAVCEGDAEALAREIVRVLRDGRRSNGRDLIARLSLDATTARTLECYRSLGLPVPLLDGWPLNDA
jgi:glycosyltransferase involved in cell wall biosynthesis